MKKTIKKTKWMLSIPLAISIGVIPFALISCGSGSETPKPDPDGGGDNNGGDGDKPKPPPVVVEGIITTLPRVEIKFDKNGKLLNKIAPLKKLVKYIIEIPKIPNFDSLGNTLPGTISLDEQSKRYKEALVYLVGSDNNPDWLSRPKNNTFAWLGNAVWSMEDKIFQEYIPQHIKYFERYFWNTNNETRKAFFDKLGKDDAFVSSTIAIPWYLQTQNMNQVSRFLASYSWFKLKLIEAKNVRGNAMEFFKTDKTPNSAKRFALQAITSLNEYFNPLTGQLMANRDQLLFNNFKDYGITGMRDVYKMLVRVTNEELKPFLVAIDEIGYGWADPQYILDAKEVFKNVAGQYVKSSTDFTKNELDEFWRKFVIFGNNNYGWLFDPVEITK